MINYDSLTDTKEIGELIEKYFKLQIQINNPTRDV